MRENCTSGSMRGSGRPTLHAASLPLSTLPDIPPKTTVALHRSNDKFRFFPFTP